jgi:hypothetical protein
MAQQGRKICFFLGAGASVGAGAFAKVQHGGRIFIPTQATFWDTFLRFCQNPANRKAIESFLFRYFLGYERVPARATALKRRAMFKGIDVEEVFTFISERVRAPATSSALRTYAEGVWDALVAEIPIVFSRFRPNKKTQKTYRDLLNKFVLSRDAIVSFNYDTIFEYSLPHNRRWCYEGVSVCNNALRVLKPHGSVNWQAGQKIVVQQKPSHCVVVAPTHLKFVQTHPSSSQNGTGHAGSSAIGYLDQSKQIEKIWSEMEREMRQAKALVFVGYSFPAADLYFASVLRSVLASRDGTPAMVIVNPDAVAIRDRLQGRFPIAKVLLYFDLGAFLQSSREQLMKQLK